jgi:hypothetical protein
MKSTKTPDVVLTNFTRGAQSFSRLLDKLREFEITRHNEVLTILTQYQQLFITFGEVTSLTPEEHEYAFPLIDGGFDKDVGAVHILLCSAISHHEIKIWNFDFQVRRQENFEEILKPFSK